MKRTLLFLIAFCFVVEAQSQQLGLFHQYRDNYEIFNPASLERDFLQYGQTMSAGFSYRHQWASIDFAPRTAAAKFSWVNQDNKINVGAYLINDQTGPTGFSGAYGRFSYIISSEPENWGVSVGLSGGIVQYRINLSEIEFTEQGYVDGMANVSTIYPDLGLGAFYYQYIDWGGYYDGDYIYAGLSVPQVLGLNLSFTEEVGQFQKQRNQHFYALLGTVKYLGESTFIEPSAMVKYIPNSPINIDANVRLQVVDGFFIGAGWASSEEVHVEIGLSLAENAGFDNARFSVAYGYEYAYQTFGPNFGSTHEINLRYSFGGQ